MLPITPPKILASIYQHPILLLFYIHLPLIKSFEKKKTGEKKRSSSSYTNPTNFVPAFCCMTPFWDPQFLGYSHGLPPGLGETKLLILEPLRLVGLAIEQAMFAYIYIYTYDVAYYNVYIYDMIYVSLDEHHTHTILLWICLGFFYELISD